MEEVGGPRGGIRYQRDELGYPRIEARDAQDGAYALGALHATDRLVQVQTWLTAARGELMQMLGDWPLMRLTDRLTRAFGFQRDLDAQLAALAPETRAWLDAYASGFDDTARRRERPMALKLLRLPIRPFSARSVLELWRMGAFFGMTQMLVGQIAALAELGISGQTSRAMSLLLGPDAEGMDLSFLKNARFPGLFAQLSPLPVGSNAFAVTAQRSQTGSALLMSEFHIQTGVFPPMMYPFHIEYADGSFYTGMGAPGLPWANAGRTASVGWSTTFGHADTIHVAIERFSGGRYLTPDGWKTPTTHRETVGILPFRKETWTHHVTDFGVILGEDVEDGDAACMRWSGFGELASDITAYHRMHGAQSAAELIDVLRGVRTIGLEMAVCDSSGQVGKLQTGVIEKAERNDVLPFVRKGWDMVRPPVAFSEGERPVTLAPESGQVVCANQGAPPPWAQFPETSYRFDRISEMLSARAQHTPSSLCRISYDESDLCATRLVKLWRSMLPATDPRVLALARWADSQTGVLDDNGRAMLRLFHALHRELVLMLLAKFFGRFRHRYPADLALYFQRKLDDVLALGRPTLLSRAELAGMLQEAWPRAVEQADRASFQVPVHKPFVNLFTAGALPASFGFDTPAVTWPGGPMAPFQSRVIRMKRIEMVFGPGFHMVFDMAERGAWYHVPGGASEERKGPGYGRGVDLYLEGRFLPLGRPEGAAPGTHRSGSQQTGGQPG